MLDRWSKIGHLSVFHLVSSRRRHTTCSRDWSSDVCSSDLTCSPSMYQNDRSKVQIADQLTRSPVTAGAGVSRTCRASSARKRGADTRPPPGIPPPSPTGGGPPPPRDGLAPRGGSTDLHGAHPRGMR